MNQSYHRPSFLASDLDGSQTLDPASAGPLKTCQMLDFNKLKICNKNFQN